MAKRKYVVVDIDSSRAVMASQKEQLNSAFGIIPTLTRSALSSATVCLLNIAVAKGAPAQTHTVIHNFTGARDGACYAGLSMDRTGNFCGTTASSGAQPGGGSYGQGVIFQITPN
jgi:hypothetical protein